MDKIKLIFNIGLVNHLFGSPYKNEETGIILYDLPWAFAITAFIMIILIAYLLGSINFAMVISSKKYKEDIRDHGSGNAGMTNMMRTYGKKAAILTLFGDILKTALAALIGYLIMGKAGAYVAGVGAVIGHTWPLYYGFKGGKGVATAIAMILCTEPLVALILLLIFVAIVAASKFISLGSIMGALMYPIILSNFAKIGLVEMICCFLIVILLVFNHRSNIMRLYQGKENKFSFKKSEKPKE